MDHTVQCLSDIATNFVQSNSKMKIIYYELFSYNEFRWLFVQIPAQTSIWRVRTRGSPKKFLAENGQQLSPSPVPPSAPFQLVKPLAATKMSSSKKGLRLQPADIGLPTGDGKKLSNSQACCLAQLCLAAAYFLSIYCGPSYRVSHS